MADEPRQVPATLNFDYIKSNQFRVLHADGAFLSLNPTGLTVTFFSERQPIPRRTVHKLNSDGTVGDEIPDQRVVRDAVVRDAEIAVVMNLDAAKRIRDKFDEMIKRFEDATKDRGEAKTL
jgi:hypothetical protein